MWVHDTGVGVEEPLICTEMYLSNYDGVMYEAKKWIL